MTKIKFSCFGKIRPERGRKTKSKLNELQEKKARLEKRQSEEEAEEHEIQKELQEIEENIIGTLKGEQ